MTRPTVRKVRSSLWFVPVVCVLVGLVLSFTTIAIERGAHGKLVPEWLTGGPDAALAILSTIAASMVSLAALVLTITMVVVQLAMGQFSPRIVQTILKDKPSQIAIGLFIATFAHSMLALREVRFEDPVSVPGLAIVVAYVLVLVSLVVLVLYVHHIGRSLRVAALIELVGSDTRRLIDEQYSGGDVGHREDDSVVAAPSSGVVCDLDHEQLVDAARQADCTLVMLPAVGEFVPAGATLFRVDGDPRGLDTDAVVRAVVLGLERTLERDVAYGFRMLVDIAVRSVSESAFLDPTSSVQAIDRLHDGLRQLATRDFPDGVCRDEDGEVRLVFPVMCWDDFVVMSFEEIRLAGAASPQVTRRVAAALEDLLEVAPPERQGVLQEQLALLHKAVREAAPPGADIELNLRADNLGLGVLAGDRRRDEADADRPEQVLAEGSSRARPRPRR